MPKTIYFDGACLPVNPGGIACFGIVAIDENNIRIKEKWGIVAEHGTNNIAEWTGLIEAIRAAKELGWKNVKILGDSQLVVHQFNGLWEIRKKHLRKLYREAQKEASDLKKIKVSWIPREKNLADPVCHKAFIDHVENKARERAEKEIEKYSIRQIDENHFIVSKQNKEKEIVSSYDVVLSPSFSCTCPFFVRYNSYPLLKRSNLKVKCKHYFILQNLLEKVS